MQYIKKNVSRNKQMVVADYVSKKAKLRKLRLAGGQEPEPNWDLGLIVLFSLV